MNCLSLGPVLRGIKGMSESDKVNGWYKGIDLRGLELRIVCMCVCCVFSLKRVVCVPR